ncbi:MAG: DUF429 domain-containing protein [Clostridia bacterium]|nr:DUF429 domain-containing protein [Clostridia bacterium]
MSSITTYLKKNFDPLTAAADEIDIVDIAHALHLLCRANGHFPHFYSVGQHSINCAKEASERGCSKRVQLGCLLHDASEAYMSDVTRPLKKLLPEYLKAEERLQNVIWEKWISPELTAEEKKQIFEIDDAVLYYEFLALMGKKTSDEEPALKSKPSFDFEDFSKVKNAFLDMFNSLTAAEDNKIYVGVDWMKGSWIACELADSSASYKIFKTIDELCNHYEAIHEILIDIPVGLPETSEEALLRPDIEARKYLKAKNRKSSVFPVPLRQLVYAKSEAEVWELNTEFGGKLSKPAVGILPCIKQVDSFLQNNPEWKERLVESHPECAFQALNKGKGLDTSKHTTEGIEERISILSQYVFNVRELVFSASKSKQADILDSMCLAVTSKLGYVSIPENPAYDKSGLPMRIVVADI